MRAAHGCCPRAVNVTVHHAGGAERLSGGARGGGMSRLGRAAVPAISALIAPSIDPPLDPILSSWRLNKRLHPALSVLSPLKVILKRTPIQQHHGIAKAT